MLDFINQLFGLIVRHEIVFFLVIGGVLERLIMALFRWLPNAGADWVQRFRPIYTDPLFRRTFPKTLPIAIFVMALALGSKQAIPRTAALPFPDPVCNHGNSKLLLFLHGWRGDSVGTWRQFPHLTCADSTLSDLTVLAVDYPISITERNMRIGQFASWINDRLIANGTAQFKKIAIIAHSMGGLIARKMILERRPELKIGLLIEEGTPHTGAANYTAMISILGLKGSDVVDEMLSGSEFLIDLQDQWNHLKPGPTSHCFTSGGDNVVSRESATYQCGEYHYYAPSVDHIGLVKPDSVRDDRYAMPIELVRVFMAADSL
jgi:pimeloyl-ACP methyl ester carboxylesterase